MSTQQKHKPQNSTLRLVFVALTATAFTSLAVAASTDTLFQISDAVTSGTGQNVFSSDSKTFTGTSSTQLVYNNGSGSSYIVIKFGETSLTNVGDKITLSYSVAVTNGNKGAQNTRVGLFDVGTATDSDFQSATGYRADYGSSVNSRGFYDRNIGGGGNLFAGTSYTQFDPTTFGYSRGDFTLNTLDPAATVNLSGTFSIELLAGNKVKISSFISLSPTGLVATIIDDAGVFTTFNSMAFWTTAGANGGNVLTFSDLTVTSTSTIPEPVSIAAWLSGILAMAGVMIRRCRLD